MGEDSSVQLAQLMVNNWASFFLSKLNHLYANHRLCDVTLRFSNSESIQLHRLVLSACTDYFDAILSNDSNQHYNIVLDNSFKFEIVSVIVKFMYTGKIVFQPEVREELFIAASNLRMTILANLLDKPIHTGGGGGGPSLLPVSVSDTVTRSPAVDIDCSMTQNEVLRPLVKNEMPTPKRLNIWKRKPPVTSLMPSLRDNGVFRVVLSKPIPTRLDWEESLSDHFPIMMVGDALKHMSHENNVSELQHPLSLGADERFEAALPSPAKRHRPSTDMQELAIQQQIRHEMIMEADGNEDVDDPDPLEPVTPPKPILKQTRSESEPTKRVRFVESRPDVTITPVASSSSTSSSATTSAADEPSVPSELVSLTVISNTPVETPRAASPPVFPMVNVSVPATAGLPAVGVQVARKSATSGELVFIPHGSTFPKRLVYSVLDKDGNDVMDEDPFSSTGVANPVKIVSEVLMKNPDLMTGKRKSIKVKVANPTNNVYGHPHKADMNPVYYITVKACDDVIEPESLTAERNRQTMLKEMDLKRSAPWRCTTCTKPETPIKFSSYIEFRTHAVNVHGVAQDPKICQFCGFWQHKRNMMLFHLYVKHHVPPPSHTMFPKCVLCQQIQMSQAALNRHMNTSHQTYECKTCNVNFTTPQAMTNHWDSDWHRENVNKSPAEYPCPFCSADFEQADQLKGHIESEHQSGVIERSQTESVPKIDLAQTSKSNNDQDSTVCLVEDVTSVSASPPVHADATVVVVGVKQEGSDGAVDPAPISSQSLPLQATSETDGVVKQDMQQSETEYDANKQDESYEENVSEGLVIASSDMESEEQELPSSQMEQYPCESYAEPEEEPPGEYHEDGGGHYQGETVAYEQEGAVFVAQEDAYGATNGHGEQEGYMVEERNHSEGEVIEQPTECIPEDNGEQEQEQAREYAPYNPVMMIGHNMVIPQRVMLVTHPMTHNLSVLLPNMMPVTEQLVAYPQVQVVATTAGPVVTSVHPSECIQPPRERKVEPETLVDDWDESNQAEGPSSLSVVPAQPGTGPSRPDFF